MRFNSSIPQNGYLFRRSSLPLSLHSMLKSLVQDGQYREAIKLYSRQGSTSLPTASHLIFPPLLKACTALSSIPHGKIIHAKTIQMGLQFDPYIATSLVNMYVRSGSLGYAVQVFAKMSESQDSARDVTLWNAMIDGYFKFREFDMGLDHLYQMQSLGIRPDIFTITILLGACGSSSSFSYVSGKQIHGFMVRNFSRNDPFLETALIAMYSGSRNVTHAWHVFETLQDKSNVAVWNAMIAGLCGNGIWKRSLELFLLAKHSNCKLSSGSFVSALTACSQGGDLTCGQQIHLDVVKTGFEHDPFVCTSLLSLYARCGFVKDAEHIFDDVPDKRIELWNAMISGYVNNCCEYDALNVFVRLKSRGIFPDPVTISNVLSACFVNDLYDFGITVHAELIKTPLQNNVAVQSALLNFYSKHGITENAKAVFGMIGDKDVVAWGSMISGFYQNESLNESLDLFRVMLADAVKPDSNILSSLICACAGLDDIHLGSAIHGFSVKSGFELDVFVASSLIEMYSKGGFLEDAETVFSLMPYKNLVAWNSMVSCYCKNKKPERSISLFHQIERQGLYPDSVSFTNVLVAVSSLAGFSKGKEIHGYLLRNSTPSDIQVENAMIDMYIKSGSLSYARTIFNGMPTRNLVTWNSIISGYGSHGQCFEAIKLFDEMKRSGTRPDDVTFLSLITSCSHSGLIDQGLELFHSMKPVYLIEPKMEHYMNVVDLLGRAGRLEEAYRFIQSMKMDADHNIWRCLLFACCTHGNFELGELAGQSLCSMEGVRSSDVVQLLKLYGESGLWDKAARLRGWMKEMGLKKVPGCSWIEVRNETNTFVSGDSSSPFSKDIFEMLNRITSEMGSYEEDYYYDSNIELS